MEKLLKHQTKNYQHLIPIIVLSFGIIIISYLVANQFNLNDYSINSHLKAELLNQPIIQSFDHSSSSNFNQLLKLSNQINQTVQ